MMVVLVDVDDDVDEDDFDEALNSGRKDKRQAIRRAIAAESVNNTLHYLTSPAYKKGTSENFMLKFLTFLEENGHEGMLDDGWSAHAIHTRMGSLNQHREAILRRFCSPSDESYQILPHHCQAFLDAFVNKSDLVAGATKTGRKSGCEFRLSHGYALRARTGATAFFRELGVLEKWRWTNDAMTAGAGCPFYSKDVTKLLNAIRRRELREGTYTPSISQPVMSRDFVMYGAKVCALELEVYKRFIEDVKGFHNARDVAHDAHESSDDEGREGTRRILEPTHRLQPIGSDLNRSEPIGPDLNRSRPIGSAN